jgi:hypothetical protein
LQYCSFADIWLIMNGFPLEATISLMFYYCDFSCSSLIRPARTTLLGTLCCQRWQQLRPTCDLHACLCNVTIVPDHHDDPCHINPLCVHVWVLNGLYHVINLIIQDLSWSRNSLL